MRLRAGIMTPDFRSRRWRFVLLASVAAAASAFCIAGYVMAADYTVADSSHLAHWNRVGTVYLAVGFLAAVLVCAAVAGMFRLRVVP